MNRVNQIINEVATLNMFEVTTQLVKFLREEYGLTSAVDKQNLYIDIYIKDFRHNDEVEDISDDKIAKSILKEYNKLVDTPEALNVFPTEYGYSIILTEDLGEASEAKLKENIIYYYYHDYDRDEGIEEDKNLNKSMRTKLTENEEADRLRELTRARKEEKEETEEEVVDEPDRDSREANYVSKELLDKLDVPEEEELKSKEDLINATDLSNTVLDNRFIWFFVVFDENEDEMTEQLDSLDDAIDFLIYEDSASLLVAYPYIDPNPEDDSVDLVMSDNPGPIIIYNGEVE